MKKLFYLLIAVLLIACKGDEPKVFQIDPLATVNIKPAAGTVMKVKSNVNVEHLTALEIVKQATLIQYHYNDLVLGRGLIGFDAWFPENLRDTVSIIPCLKMYAGYIISDGELQPQFIEGRNIILIHINGSNSNGIRDTIAYIPNSVIQAAEIAIKAAYADKDLESIYKLFNEAYTFTPITGSEWRVLKANNQQ